MRLRRATILFVLILAGVGFADGPATDRAEDERAIRALVDEFIRAYNAGDAPAIAGQFTDDARIVVEGADPVEGRAAIREQFAATFEADPGGTIAVEVASLRFPGPDVALEDGTTTSTPGRADGQDGRPESGRYSLVYVRRDGHWRVAEIREDSSSSDAEPQPQRLRELEWLLGDWIDEGAEAVIATSCRWDDGRRFLVRSFTIRIQGRPALSGTQRIGWDPATRQIRSWLYDSEGGHGEALWARDGDRWIIKATSTQPDGRVATATNILGRRGPDGMTWRSVDRTLGGEVLPDVDEYTLVRKPPEPE